MVKGVYRLLVATILLLLPVGVFGQKSEELQNSYYFKRGSELLFGENPDESQALDFFTKELGEHPKNGYAYYYMGLIYDHNDQEGDALDCFNKAVNLLKKDKQWISFAYRMRARTHLKLNNGELAEKDWNASLKENPSDANTLCDRAAYYYYKGENDLAEADYDAVIHSQPSDIRGYQGKAALEVLKQEYQKAADLYSYCIKLSPNEASPYTGRAWCYKALQKYSEASDDLIQALRIESNNNSALRTMLSFESPERDILLAKLRIEQAKDKNNSLWPYYQAIIYENSEEFLKAIEAYKKADDISTSDALMERISNCYSELGEYDLALNYINKAIVMDSTETSYLSQKGSILYELGRTKEAIDVYTAYIDKNPDDAYGYYERGFAKDNTGDRSGALEDYTTSLVINPDDAYALVERGDCYRALGKEDAAIADYKKATEIDTTYTANSCAHYAYLALGEKDKAIAFMDSVFAHNQDKGTYYDAACLYSRMGEYDKAMSYLNQALQKGFRRLNHIMNDQDLDGLKNRQDFKALIDEYRARTRLAQEEQKKESGMSDVSVERVSEIPFTRETGGLCKVKCNINGLPLNFWLDTGASDVSLSMVEATFMLKNGYLTKDDVTGSSYFLDANGNVSEGTVINLRTVKFGDSELNNVKASVVKNLKAPLLLGQSILARLGSVEIDNTNQVIRIKYYK